jgi:hypothetical protein
VFRPIKHWQKWSSWEIKKIHTRVCRLQRESKHFPYLTAVLRIRIRLDLDLFGQIRTFGTGS